MINETKEVNEINEIIKAMKSMKSLRMHLGGWQFFFWRRLFRLGGFGALGRLGGF